MTTPCAICNTMSLSYALQALRHFAEQGDEQERAVATQLANFVQRTERDQRRARIAGTRLLRAARRYKQAAKRMEKAYGANRTAD